MQPPNDANAEIRVPPHNAQAETAVIGCVMLDPNLLDSLGWLRAADFYSSDNAKIWDTLQSMRNAGQSVDTILLAERLKASGGIECEDGAEYYIVQCAQSVGSTAHAVGYANAVAGYAKRRGIIHAATQAIHDAYELVDEPDEILGAIEGDLARIRTSADMQQPITCRQAAEQALALLAADGGNMRSQAATTGVITLDERYGGLFPGELTILAARPGVGKTSLAMQVANHNAHRGRLVYFISLEMLPSEQALRLACAESGLSNHDIRCGRYTEREYSQLKESLGSQTENLLFHPSGDVTVQGILRSVRQLARRGLKLVVVDYLQLITPRDRRVNREEQVATISRGLKKIPRDYGIPLLCLCQLNRQVVDEYKEPTLSQLRESGAIEQDADAVWFLWKHKPSSDGSVNVDKDIGPWNAVLGVAKNRNGETGKTPLNWIPRQTKFEPWEPAGLDEFSDFI